MESRVSLPVIDDTTRPVPALWYREPEACPPARLAVPAEVLKHRNKIPLVRAEDRDYQPQIQQREIDPERFRYTRRCHPAVDDKQFRGGFPDPGDCTVT